MNIKDDQRRLFELLSAQTRCFVRVCDDDSALWVSDLPRKMEDCACLAQQLQTEGFLVRQDDAAKLWYVDWTESQWQKMIEPLPERLPSLPDADELHEVYALCRLWMLHPAPRAHEHMPIIRRMVKLTAERPQAMRRSIRMMHEESAALLRQGGTLPYDAGRVLAAWLKTYASEKEMKT